MPNRPEQSRPCAVSRNLLRVFLSLALLVAPTGVTAETSVKVDVDNEAYRLCANNWTGVIKIRPFQWGCWRNEREVDLSSHTQDGDGPETSPPVDRRLYVVDGDGNPVGLYAGEIQVTTSSFYTRVYLEDLGFSIGISPEAGTLAPLQRSYSSAGCQGDAFVSTRLANIAFPSFRPSETGLFIASNEIVPISPPILSADVGFGSFCSPTGSARTLENQLLVIPLDEPIGLEFPLPLPLTIRTLADS